MRQFLIYIGAISIAVAVAQRIAESFWGGAAGTVTALVSIYLITVFDLRIANPHWSMLRRILPNVSVVDLAVYALPFGYMIALVSGALLTQNEPVLHFIIALPLYLIWSVYLLVRLPRMRRGSGDDLSWMLSLSMPVGERFRRYLGVAPEQR